jgi:hypothetical protein
MRGFLAALGPAHMQALDLELGEVLAIAAHVPVAASARRDCP